MAYLSSVGVQVTETDLTPIIQPTSSSIGAYVGHFNWGPCDHPTSVTSETTLGQIFGFPQKSADLTSKSFLTASSFLKYGDTLKVIRCIGDNAKNAVGSLLEPSGLSEDQVVSNYFFKNENIFETTDLEEGLTQVFCARYPGKKGNSLFVKVFHRDNTDKTEPQNGDNITDCKGIFTYLPETTDWGTTNDHDYDEIHIVVIDQEGEITGTKNSILERWEGLSLNPESKLTNGSTNYFADVLNRSSAYLYVVNGTELYETTDTNGIVTYSVGAPTVVTSFNFAGGLDGSIEVTNVIASLAIFNDIENIDINLLFAEAFSSDLEREVNNTLATVAVDRRDCIAFLSAPLDLYKENSDQAKLEALLAAKDLISLSSYIVFDSSPIYTYNRYADKYEWIPACGHMAGLCAYTDEVADAWFSPAGLNRGQLRGVTKLAYNPKQADRDELYNNNINSIMTFPGQGTVLWGDKTGQPRATAFDRINVRRLFNVIQKEVKKAARYQLFELNDDFTRTTFRNSIEPFLRDVKGRRGITDFKVVCDESNNTADVIDANQFVASIYIKPARSINFITLNFVATRTSLSFTEI